MLRKEAGLDNSNLSFSIVMEFIYCWIEELTGVEFCKYELRINKSTVVDWNNHVLEFCAANLVTNPVVTGGPNTNVEVDESLFNRRKFAGGHVSVLCMLF